MIELIDKTGIDIFFGSQSTFVDHIALHTTNAFVWIPMFIVLFILIIKNHDSMQQILLCMACIGVCILLTSGTANLIVKPLVERVRPCNDPQFKYLAQIAGNMHERDFSFFSAHAANTMAVATFFALLVRSGLLSVTLYCWSLLNVWTRLYLGQHFLTDVIVGMAWGAVAGLMGYYLYRNINRNISSSNNFISSQYTSTGFSFLDIDVVVSVFALTLVVITLPLDDVHQWISMMFNA